MEKIIQLKSSGINLLWINRSSGQRTVLVFLHEALGSVAQWKTFPERLCNELNLGGIIIERSGHGKSSGLTGPRNEHYLHNYTAETKKVLDEILPVETKIIFIGHSDGGTISLLYAKHYPKNITGVCTMAAHTFVETETLAGIEPAIEAYESGKLDGLKRIHGDKTDALFYAWADTWRAVFFLSWDIREEIKGIPCPVLAVQGTDDQYGTKAQVDSIAEAAGMCETVMIADCKHHPHIEKPEEIIKIIESWYKTIL